MEKLEPLIRRIFFYGAFVLGAIAAVEKAVNLLLNKSFLNPVWTAHDLIEFAAVALIFSIAMQLHQIRLLLSAKPSESPK